MATHQGKRSQLPRKPPTANPEPARRRSLSGLSNLDVAICIGLIVAIVIIYAQVSGFDFVNYDDGDYVYSNSHIQQGITAANLKWIWTAVVASNWMPLTLFSHMLDVQLFGLNAGMHHLDNVLWHALSALLLFAAFRRATGSPWPSAFVAFLFAAHPLHVGSVAWIAERKDVLSTFFWSLALYCYIRYAERPRITWYLAVAASFCLGLMAKPMLVTFPFTLLLFDVWPLRRLPVVSARRSGSEVSDTTEPHSAALAKLPESSPAGASSEVSNTTEPRTAPRLAALERWNLPKLILEKAPLFALSAVVSAVTYLVQSSVGVVQRFPLGPRIANAVVSYATYLLQAFVPVRLAVFYPLDFRISAARLTVALLLLLAVSSAVIWQWRARPYLATGWFWFLGTLVPVIGLVQVGAQAHADRYMYIPLIGLSVMLAWGALDILRRWPAAKPFLVTAAIASSVVMVTLATSEASYWHNSESLFKRAIEVTDDNWVAQTNLAHYLMNAPGRAVEAIPHFEAALPITPDPADIDNDLGACLLLTKQYAAAVPYLEKSVHLKPDKDLAHYNLGMALAHSGRESDAIVEYEAALRLRPDNDLAHNNLGLLLLKQGRKMEALAHFAEAVRLHPDYGCERNLGDTLATIPGREAEAIVHLQAAQRFNPDPTIAQSIERLRKAVK